MKEEPDESVKEEEEERDAWMADPFPDEKLRYWKVQLSMEVFTGEEEEEEEGEEVEEVEEEGEMVTSDALRVTASGEEEEVAMIEVRVSVPSV